VEKANYVTKKSRLRPILQKNDFSLWVNDGDENHTWVDNIAIWNESGPKIIINDTISFRVLFDKVASLYFN